MIPMLTAIASITLSGGSWTSAPLDVGQVYFNKPLDVTLSIVNDLPTKQRISVVTDCSCLTPSDTTSKISIPPSGSSHILLSYKPQKNLGIRINRVALINEETKKEIGSISIQSEVVRDFDIRPTALSIDPYSSSDFLGECVVSSRTNDISLKEVDLQLPTGLKVSVTALAPNQSLVKLFRGSVQSGKSVIDAVESMKFQLEELPTGSTNERLLNIPIVFETRKRNRVVTNQRVYRVPYDSQESNFGVTFSLVPNRAHNLTIDSIKLLGDAIENKSFALAESVISNQTATSRLSVSVGSRVGELITRNLTFVVRFSDGSEDDISVQIVLLPK